MRQLQIAHSRDCENRSDSRRLQKLKATAASASAAQNGSEGILPRHISRTATVIARKMRSASPFERTSGRDAKRTSAPESQISPPTKKNTPAMEKLTASAAPQMNPNTRTRGAVSVSGRSHSAQAMYSQTSQPSDQSGPFVPK